MAHQKKLQAAGWEIVEQDKELYDEFLKKREFTTQNRGRVKIPADSLIYDFGFLSGRRSGQGAAFEKSLRYTALDCFRAEFGNKQCVLLDVNHTSYKFVPNDLVLDEEFEPWPCDLLPGYAFISLTNNDFSIGLFSNWGPKLWLAVYGAPLVLRMRERFSKTLIELPSESR